MNHERAEVLEIAFLEGELTLEELAEFDALLKADPELLRSVADRYEIHRGLGRLHQPTDIAAFSLATLSRIRSEREVFVGSVKKSLRAIAPTQAKKRADWKRVLFASAALIAVAILISEYVPASKTATPPVEIAAPAPLSVATLVRTSKARWEPDTSLLEGQRLSAGALRLGVGHAVLLFDSGAIVAVQAPAHLSLESRSVLRVTQGRVTVRAQGDAAGFTVRTPAGDVQDLGTEFSVSVHVSGAAEVHVQQGEVAWLTKPDEPPTRILHAGAAVRFDSLKEPEGHPIEFLPQTIDDFIRQISASLPPREPFASESFEYSAGEMNVDRGNGGVGWMGPWRLRQGGEITREKELNPLLSIRPASLAFQQPGGHGGALEFQPNGYSVRIRQLSEPIDLGREAVYYLSFLLRREGGLAESKSDFPHFRLTLRRASDFWGPSVGLGFPKSGCPTVQLFSRDTFVAPFKIDNDVTTLWVLKIVAHRRQADEAFLKVFKAGEAVPAIEPAPWSVVTDRFPADGPLDLVVVTGSGPLAHIFDELRVGRTWESVTGKD